MVTKLIIKEDLESSGVYSYPAIGILNGTVEYTFYERNPNYDWNKAHELPIEDRPTSFIKTTKTYHLDKNKAYNNISEILEDLHTINPNIPTNLKEYDNTIPSILKPKAGRSTIYVDDKTHNCIVSWYNFETRYQDCVRIPIYFLPRYVTSDEFYKIKLNK